MVGFYTTYYYKNTDSNGSDFTKIFGFEIDLLTMVLKQMNMTFVHVPTQEGFEIEGGLTDNLIRAVIAKEVFIALGFLGTHNFVDQFLDYKNSYYIMSYRWYILCSDKY